MAAGGNTVTIRAGLAAAAVCAAALACEAPAPPPGAEGPSPAADARPSEGAPPAGTPSPGRRGDRHARAAARAGARSVHQVAGTVIRVEGGRVAIQPPRGREVTLRIGPRTTVTTRRGGGQGLAPGDEVRASWRTGGDPPTAVSVEVQPADVPFTDRG